MKQFNKPNEELTDQELQELIMSDRTLASIVEPHTVIGQVYKRYYAKLATLQKDNWISVDERLPEPYETVIMVAGDKIRTGFYDSDIKIMVMPNTLHNKPVTHWQPLPPSPSKPDQNG